MAYIAKCRGLGACRKPLVCSLLYWDVPLLSDLILSVKCAYRLPPLFLSVITGSQVCTFFKCLRCEVVLERLDPG